jgi:hypothetical protein
LGEAKPADRIRADMLIADFASLNPSCGLADIDSLNDINLESLTDSVLFNLNIAINPLDWGDGLRRFLDAAEAFRARAASACSARSS